LNDIITNEPSEIYTDVTSPVDDEDDEFEICLTEKGDDESVKVGRESVKSAKEELKPIHKG
jgi:hypothetical protein